MHKDININNKTCYLMKPALSPKYGSKTILTNSCWEYVTLFLTRRSASNANDALFYWKQAHIFYLATKLLPNEASPLTSYYCILNASKALLRFKGVLDSALKTHGISTPQNNGMLKLKDSTTCVKGGGVLFELTQYYDSHFPSGILKIEDILYNIPCIHRAYCVTYNKPELFIPIISPAFVKKENSDEAWLKFCVSGKYADDRALKLIPAQFEHDIGITGQYVIRQKRRFRWDIHTSMKQRKQSLIHYHKTTRKYFYYILGDTKLWYLKKVFPSNIIFQHSASPVLIFCISHWLSELVRYTPKLFHEYMKSKSNWVIHEFITNSLNQFIDEIACEITGNDIMVTGIRK